MTSPEKIISDKAIAHDILPGEQELVSLLEARKEPTISLDWLRGMIIDAGYDNPQQVIKHLLDSGLFSLEKDIDGKEFLRRKTFSKQELN